MEEYITVLLKIWGLNQTHDLRIPNDITAKELLEAVVTGYRLELNTNDISQCYLVSENPPALLKGDEKLSVYGIHNGTIINLMR